PCAGRHPPASLRLCVFPGPRFPSVGVTCPRAPCAALPAAEGCRHGRREMGGAWREPTVETKAIVKCPLKEANPHDLSFGLHRHAPGAIPGNARFLAHP